ncbi:MAG: BlaI/MecI/CopY family transcriptional regulator [Verrucomicrobiales bacterium]|nr:BlaI/MecI/CopY family transcriptional regulator [Verrucomicrobiales bacterium]
MTLAQPTNLELQALSVLWALGSASVREVWQSFPDGKERAYTTVLTVLQNLERKGLVRKKNQGRQNIYIPTRTKGPMLRPFLKNLVEHVFHGQAAELISQVLQEVRLSAGEVKAVAKLLAQRRAELVGGAKPKNKTNKKETITMAAKKKAAKKAPAKKAGKKKAAKKKAPAKKVATKKPAAKKSAAKGKKK